MRKRILTEDDLRDIENDLQDLDLAGRTSTIVIANYDSYEKSKKGADIVINKGENASIKINDAIQSLKGTGGEVKLMEGEYNLEYGIAVNIPNVHLTGIPNATMLKVNKNWSNDPINNKRDVINTNGLEETDVVRVSNLIVIGNKSYVIGFSCLGSSQIINCTSKNNDSSGFYCEDNSQVANCISEGDGTGFNCRDNSQIINCISKDTRKNGFNCRDNSQIINCISKDSNEHGFSCQDNSRIINCISKNNNHYGFSCWDNSQITNCTSENNNSYGFYCWDKFKGICSFNTLKRDKLNDDSSSLSVVEYNVIQEG